MVILHVDSFLGRRQAASHFEEIQRRIAAGRVAVDLLEGSVKHLLRRNGRIFRTPQPGTDTVT